MKVISYLLVHGQVGFDIFFKYSRLNASLFQYRKSERTQNIGVIVAEYGDAYERHEAFTSQVKVVPFCLVRGADPFQPSDGFIEERVDNMLEEAEAELLELRARIYTKWHFTWAIKRT